MDDTRPDPDELLKRLQEEETQASRGKLKIFFGASAGVGKTYAMLSAARQQLLQGVDVVIGVVETHGRMETEVMTDGVARLPLREMSYRNRVLKEFDLDGAMARKPGLILVDELAHSNAAGTRHPKRWQDVEELLAAGINVYTTINVQHIETLNDVVGGITGIRVWETVPDKVFDTADEVVLVDLPPDELLQRLKEGKVYLPHQAERAIQNFFRKGNLIALRELALRRTADRVDGQMLKYRRDKLVASVWQTRESLLVCVGPGHNAEKVVRSAARNAARLDMLWHAVYVETPALQRLPEKQRQHILKALKLAQDMGAQTATLSGSDPVDVLVGYARAHNLAKVVVGRTLARPWRYGRRSFADRLGAHAPELDILQVARDEPRSAHSPRRRVEEAEAGGRERTPWQSFAKSGAACAATTGVAALLFPLFDLANIVMLFLLAVVLVAVRYGRGPAVFASFLSVAAFDFFFVPPRFSFAVSDVQYLLTFAVMLAVGLITGQLTAGLKYQARVATHRESRVRALYEMAQELSGALMPEQIAQICYRFVEYGFDARAALLLADPDNRLLPPLDANDKASTVDLGIAQWAYDHNQEAGLGTDTLPGSAVLYLPLQAPMRVRGVLAIEPQRSRRLMVPEQRRLLDTSCRLIAIALERVHFVEVAQNTTVQMESERLRNSLLAALSHDLRTPLTVLIGLADSLASARPPLADAQQETAGSIRDEARRMNALVGNLLDMARLQSGEVRLDRQWQPLEEVVGTSLRLMAAQLARHTITVRLPGDLPLLEFDAVLMERVLCNLLENAAKYVPAGGEIGISAHAREDTAEIWVEDNGPGLRPGSEEEIFKKFNRGANQSTTTGVGLGLAICRAILDAHHGKIRAENRPQGGARFVMTLPLGQPPQVDALESHAFPEEER